MEFCLSIEIQEGLTYAETLALARAAEDAGFAAALLAEHYYPSSGRVDLMSADAWLYLGALARETRRIRLGTLVSPVTFRHPAVLAKMAATLDHLSNGRAELGLGAGWLDAEHAAYGFAFPPAPERVDLLEEQLQVVRGLWTDDPFSHAGPRYRLHECRFTPRPVQHPHPPLLIGGGVGATRLPRLAAHYGDEYVVTLPTPEQCRAVRERLDRACDQLGLDPDEVSLAAFVGLGVGETEAEAEARLARLLEGTRPHMRRLETWIAGGPERAAEQVRAYWAAGVRRLMFSVETDLHQEMVPLLGERVAPLVG